MGFKYRPWDLLSIEMPNGNVYPPRWADNGWGTIIEAVAIPPLSAENIDNAALTEAQAYEGKRWLVILREKPGQMFIFCDYGFLEGQGLPPVPRWTEDGLEELEKEKLITAEERKLLAWMYENKHI